MEFDVHTLAAPLIRRIWEQVFAPADAPSNSVIINGVSIPPLPPDILADMRIRYAPLKDQVLSHSAAPFAHSEITADPDPDADDDFDPDYDSDYDYYDSDADYDCNSEFEYDSEHDFDSYGYYSPLQC